MVKVSLIVYIAIGVGLLLFLSLSPKHGHDHDHHPPPSRRHGHRRLKVKSNFTFTTQDHLEHDDPHHDFPHHHHHHDPVAFDPIVAEMDRHQEDKEWERMYFDEHHKEFAEIARHHDHDHDHEEEDAHHHHHDDHHEHHQQHHEPEWEEFNNPEDFLNDEDKFNVTNRLVLLFPQIDVDPADGFVSEKELTKWNLDQAMREVLHRSQREMELHDKNHDGIVSLSEYDPPAWVKSSDNNTFGYHMGWWKEEHFNASDVNGDGLLNLTEFNEERDTDKDGKINFDEFSHGLFDLVRNYEEGHNTTHHTDNSTDSHAARKLFNQLDKDSDGLLTDTELLPIIGKLHPSGHYYAKQQADYIISQTIAGHISVAFSGLYLAESRKRLVGNEKGKIKRLAIATPRKSTSEVDIIIEDSKPAKTHRDLQF
ncbi:hypothetical protein Cgig2_029925 [Carnegiea gigantea]|uniref:EF-hand domain-containing protein n=1 Tax=Carnegiea gigantea TaxID=171969 RepID=A0A9Q1GV51_9CARY|nr:hypothetical protein Cgig2_029925 [Carnegiea gigantea]